jgi:type IV pilus assembly protein PilQ
VENDFERVKTMIAIREEGGGLRKRAVLGRAIGRMIVAAGIASTAGIMLSASGAPARLVGVTAQGDAVVIESSEPAAYSVSRPDPLKLVVDMRNVSVAEARNDVVGQGAIAGVTLEQATGADGRSVARVHVALARPSEYSIRSARNTIRLEVTPRPGQPARTQAPASAPIVAVTPAPAGPPPPAPAPAARPAQHPAPPAMAVENGTKPAATLLERIRSSKTPGATTVTLVGNGPLAPAAMTESKDRPRRLVLDFQNVSSKAPAQTVVDSPLVTRVRVGVNSHQPLVTRVVMEIAATATYRLDHSGEGGRDLDVIFEEGKPGGPIVLSPADPSTAPVEPEPPITLEQAMANVAAITPKDPPADPIQALNSVGRGIQPAASVQREARPAAPAQAVQSAPARSTTPAATRQQDPPAAAMRTEPPPAAPRTETPAQARAQNAAPAAPLKPAAPQPTSPQQKPTDGSRQFTGHPIALDFEGVDLRAVLRTFADVSGLNMVIDPDVQGTVDIKLTDVPWDQALDVILRGNQLDYTVDGTIVRISKIKTLEDENRARQAASQAAAERAAQAGGLTFETFPLSYARAAELAPLLKGSLRLSKYGQVQVDTRTNTLIIADLPDQFPAIRDLLRSLDRAEPQVEVEARIVQTTRDFARAIGVQWGLNGRVMPDLANTTNLAFPNRGTVGGRLGTQSPTDPRATELESTGSAVRLGVPDATTAIGLALGAVNGAFNLDVALSALERTGKGRVLSTPRLTTQNNIQAEVAQGVQIPIQVVSNNTVTVTFKDAVLVLRVTPQITAANTVIMKVEIENATADFSRQVNGIPPVDTQRALTQVQIDDGATTVIGGIFVSQEQSTSDKVPGLHRIPILGWLFKQDRLEDESRELLIFITPRILKG